MNDLRATFAPEIVAAIERLVDERVQAALGERSAGNGSPWLSLEEAAEYLRVSPRTVDRLVKRGKVPSTPLGRRRVLNRDELDAYMRAAGEDVTPATPPRRRTRSLDLGGSGE